jgi:hypothetical protein
LVEPPNELAYEAGHKLERALPQRRLRAALACVAGRPPGCSALS